MKKLTLEQIAANRLSPEEAKEVERYPIYVLLDNIRSLYNVGSIFRTADGARVKKLMLCGITGYPPRKEIDKTALGAAETVPWEYYPDAMIAIEEMKSQNIPIIALEHTETSQAHWDYQFPFPCCLVIGNEVWGIQDEILKEANAAVEIPMYGTKHSLNVAVAFGIVLYQILQQYHEK
ncbi:MAG: TrmH family RNA methyltransferase [Calditrichaeota bacterium]|nr:MAG: TrmH family RNA methyltransferase [Calditrichota bacterium]